MTSWKTYEVEMTGKDMDLRERISVAWRILRGKKELVMTLQYKYEPTVYFDDVNASWKDK